MAQKYGTCKQMPYLCAKNNLILVRVDLYIPLTPFKGGNRATR